MSTQMDQDTVLSAGKRNRKPTHPGAILREDVLPALGIDARTFAKHAGLAYGSFERVLKEEYSISVGMAQRIGKVCGNGPALWINMQIAYDLHVTAETMAPLLATLPTLKAKKDT